MKVFILPSNQKMKNYCSKMLPYPFKNDININLCMYADVMVIDRHRVTKKRGINSPLQKT